MNLRKHLPPSFKLFFRRILVFATDFRNGTTRKLARPGAIHAMNYSIEITQPIFSNPWLANKIHNFRIAGQRVNAVVIQPGQVFSFWKTIGNPTAAKGYRKGRNIVGGKVQETCGGGLCQLSGILYHTALMAGLSIPERHNHSVDLYSNGEPRYSPLGADATVAFGYKDLRVANPFDFALRFEVEVSADTLVCRLCGEQPIVAQTIDFQCVLDKEKIFVTTLKKGENEGWEEIERSYYALP